MDCRLIQYGGISVSVTNVINALANWIIKKVTINRSIIYRMAIAQA